MCRPKNEPGDPRALHSVSAPSDQRYEYRGRVPAGWMGLGPVANFFIVLLTATELAAQAAGVGLAIGGIARPKRWLQKVALVPGAANASVGASVVGTF